jgi:hypothetical protein
MEWTRNPPTEEGFYWWTFEESDGAPIIRQVYHPVDMESTLRGHFRFADYLVINWSPNAPGTSKVTELHNMTPWWYGPLPIPNKP